MVSMVENTQMLEGDKHKPENVVYNYKLYHQGSVTSLTYRLGRLIESVPEMTRSLHSTPSCELLNIDVQCGQR